MGGLPAWSPSGKLIAFYALDRKGKDRGLHLIRPNGARERFVAWTEAQYAWSPDGRELAYIGPLGFPKSLILLSVPSGQKRRLGPANFTKPGAIAWSPDGSKVAWVAFDYQRNQDRLLIASAAGGQKPLELTHTRRLARINSPVFTADGTRVLYTVW